MKNMYVWYVGYGSNLLRERFLCYILGGKFEFEPLQEKMN